MNTSYDEFLTIIQQDDRYSSLDGGNLKLTFNALLEKAEMKEKEKNKEETRKQKKLENSFKSMLRELGVTHLDDWEKVKAKIEDNPTFDCVTNESDKIRIFKVYVR